MKNECHGGGALLFSFPRLPSWGKHFHEPGGIHLNLPSSFTYIISKPDTIVKFFVHFFYKENITTTVRYNIPNNNIAVAISSIHIFIIILLLSNGHD